MADQIPNQANFQDDQVFDIDIDKVYADFIVVIDNIRSFTNTTGVSAQAAINIFKPGDFQEALKKLALLVKIEDTVQESRCHAFFRIIGFPVVSKDFKIYNPGHDIVYDASRTINRTIKLGIAADPVEGFRDLSKMREEYVSSVTNIFSTPTTISASTLALSSGAKIRPFITPITADDPFDMDVKNQQYKVDFSSLVGSNDKQLTEYVDLIGQTPTLQPQRTHIIKPFMVDPVIDFTINDSIKLVGVPFVNNKSDLLVRDGTNNYVNRPIIEQIIRDRFTVGDQENTVGTADASVIDYIKSIPAIQDEKIINDINSGDVYKLSEQTQFVKFLNIIRAMMFRLVQAQLDIFKAQSQYYWVPIPSTNGPEGGCSTQGVFLSTQIPPDFITPRDKAIINATVRNTVNQINALSASAEGVPDVGSFAFDSFKTTFGPDSSNSLGNNAAQALTELTNNRNSVLSKANEALRIIEIITGEFSGLGLCDIIAIMGALYIMPREDLIGFLDDDAFARAQSIKELAIESNPGIQTALTSLTSTVKDFYNIMDKIYQDLSQNNGLQ